MPLGSVSLEKADFPKSPGRKAAQLPLLPEGFPAVWPHAAFPEAPSPGTEFPGRDAQLFSEEDSGKALTFLSVPVPDTFPTGLLTGHHASGA